MVRSRGQRRKGQSRLSLHEMKRKLGMNADGAPAPIITDNAAAVVSDRTAFDAWLAKNEINMNRVAMIVFPSSPGIPQLDTDQGGSKTLSVIAGGVEDEQGPPTDFDKWWALQDGHAVSVVGAFEGVAEEGGLLAPEIASPLRAMRATNANMRSPSSAAIPSRRPSMHAPMVVAPAPRADLPYLFQRPSMQTLLELTGLLSRRLRNIDRSSFLNLVIGLWVVQRHGSALVSYLLPSKEHVRAALIRALRHLAKLGVSAGAHLAVVSSTTSRLLPSPSIACWHVVLGCVQRALRRPQHRMRALLFDVATGCVSIEGGCLHIGVAHLMHTHAHFWPFRNIADLCRET